MGEAIRFYYTGAKVAGVVDGGSSLSYGSQFGRYLAIIIHRSIQLLDMASTFFALLAHPSLETLSK